MFPIIDIIKPKEFWQSLVLVSPLSEIPNNPIKSNESREKDKEKINKFVIPVIIPV